jgi:hypothetical protein
MNIYVHLRIKYICVYIIPGGIVRRNKIIFMNQWYAYGFFV